MISSYLGTILRAFFVLFSLVTIWYLLVYIVYLLAILIFSLEFDFFILNSLFIVLILFRMFYPKNVFK